MLHRQLVLAVLGATAGVANVAHADDTGIVITPFGTGGVRWTVSSPAYVTPFNYGQRNAAAYDVPVASSYRAGCFVQSPWLPVGHGDGFGQFIPDFHAHWQGIIFPLVNPVAAVFNLRVEVRDQSGGVTTEVRTVTSGLFTNTPIFKPTSDSILYRGELDSATIGLVQDLNVNEDDEVRVSVCDLVPDSSISVRHLVLQTIPFDN